MSNELQISAKPTTPFPPAAQWQKRSLIVGVVGVVVCIVGTVISLDQFLRGY